MVLDELVDKGILFKQIMAASKVTPIKFDDGVIEVRGMRIGTEHSEYTYDLIEFAIDRALNIHAEGK